MKVRCKTYFDITATGVTGHYKSSRIPFTDASGQPIENEAAWNYSRNQQRNWETITQLLSLRTQIFNINEPSQTEDFWHFEFESETPDAFGPPNNPTELLNSDSAGVPMLIDLNERQKLQPFLIVNGPNQNIWFSIDTKD